MNQEPIYVAQLTLPELAEYIPYPVFDIASGINKAMQ